MLVPFDVRGNLVKHSVGNSVRSRVRYVIDRLLAHGNTQTGIRGGLVRGTWSLEGMSGQLSP